VSKVDALLKRDNAVIRYLRETRGELAKVTWPTRDEAIRLTSIVLAVTVSMALFLGLVDWAFDLLFRLILGA